MILKIAPLLTLALLLTAPLCHAQEAKPADQKLATLMLPDSAQTPRMKKWMDYHYGLFLCFNNVTFTKQQHLPKPPPVSTYAPRVLDVDSWVKLAKDAGMKYAVLTTKHDGGFCLWDSKAQWKGKEFAYDVGAAKNKTDVVKAFMDACKKYDVAPGLYYCLTDTYANKSGTLNELFHIGKMPEDAFELAKAQLTELADNYPDCHYYWLDCPKTASVEQQGVLYDLLRHKNPDNVVLMNHHLAGPEKVGQLGAQTGEQTLIQKSTVPSYPVDVLNTEVWQKPKGVVSNIQLWQGKPLFMGYEHCDIAGSGWFNTQKPKPVAELFSLYKTVRQAGGNLLLGVGPTPAGTMARGFHARLVELKKQIDAYEAQAAK